MEGVVSQASAPEGERRESEGSVSFWKDSVAAGTAGSAAATAAAAPSGGGSIAASGHGRGLTHSGGLPSRPLVAAPTAVHSFETSDAEPGITRQGEGTLDHLASGRNSAVTVSTAPGMTTLSEAHALLPNGISLDSHDGAASETTLDDWLSADMGLPSPWLSGTAGSGVGGGGSESVSKARWRPFLSQETRFKQVHGRRSLDSSAHDGPTSTSTPMNAARTVHAARGLVGEARENSSQNRSSLQDELVPCLFVPRSKTVDYMVDNIELNHGNRAVRRISSDEILSFLMGPH